MRALVNTEARRDTMLQPGDVDSSLEAHICITSVPYSYWSLGGVLISLPKAVATTKIKLK